MKHIAKITLMILSVIISFSMSANAGTIALKRVQDEWINFSVLCQNTLWLTTTAEFNIKYEFDLSTLSQDELDAFNESLDKDSALVEYDINSNTLEIGDINVDLVGTIVLQAVGDSAVSGFLYTSSDLSDGVFSEILDLRKKFSERLNNISANDVLIFQASGVGSIRCNRIHSSGSQGQVNFDIRNVNVLF